MGRTESRLPLVGTGGSSHLRTLEHPHWLNTRQEARGGVLFIQDGGDLDFSTQRSKEDLGPLGNKEAHGLGLLMHSCLAVLPEGGEILALAYQSVGDRGSDVFSYLRRARALGWDCLLRVGQEDRRIETGREEEAGEIEHLFELRGRAGKPKRTASLKVDWTRVKIMPPRNRPEGNAEPIEGWCVRAWEEGGGGEDALEWMLFCTLAVTEADSALEKVGWYTTRRWLIEEYHKSLKTGCRMERRQLRSAAGIRDFWASLES